MKYRISRELMEFEKTSTEYRIAVSREDMRAILKAERSVYDVTLHDRLENIDGVSNVYYYCDYSNPLPIYLTLDAGHDNGTIRRQIAATIETAIAGCKMKLGGKTLKVSS